jgi:hypothetical protein
MIKGGCQEQQSKVENWKRSRNWLSENVRHIRSLPLHGISSRKARWINIRIAVRNALW